jgi:hypothetical protein
MENNDLIRILRVALASLSDRAAIFTAMLMEFGLAVWAMLNTSTDKICLVGLFGLIVFLPVLYRMSNRTQVERN